MKMETVCFSETLASTDESTRRQSPEEHHHLHCRENFKSHTIKECFCRDSVKFCGTALKYTMTYSFRILSRKTCQGSRSPEPTRTIPNTSRIFLHAFIHAWVLVHRIYTGTYKYAHIHTCAHTYIYTCTHTYKQTYIHTYTHTYIHAHIHTHTYMHIRTYIYAHIHTDKQTFIHTYMHTYIYTHTYIHIHMHTCTHTCIHTHMHTYTHACMHTYIHTFLQRCIFLTPWTQIRLFYRKQ
jgi:hypothetical protein